MGNTIDPEIVAEVNQLHLDGSPARAGTKKPARKQNLLFRLLAKLSRPPFTRKILLRLYNNLYEIFSS
jgi:hypothetical protein